MRNRAHAGSAAGFLISEEMEGDPSGREEVEAAAIKINDSNKCQCLSSSIVSITAVNDDQVAAVIDIDVNPHIDGGVPEDIFGMVHAWVAQKCLKRDILRLFTMSDF